MRLERFWERSGNVEKRGILPLSESQWMVGIPVLCADEISHWHITVVLALFIRDRSKRTGAYEPVCLCQLGCLNPNTLARPATSSGLKSWFRE